MVSEHEDYIVSSTYLGTISKQITSLGFESRILADWSASPKGLDHRVTNLLFDIWGQPTVDLFATQLNKVKVFFSRLLDPLAL